MKKIASASGNFHEIMRAHNAGNTHLIKTISCFLIGYYNKHIQGDLNAQWTTDCTKERTLLRFQDSVRTTQHSADAEVIVSQKQKDTLNTFKSFYKKKGTNRGTVT